VLEDIKKKEPRRGAFIWNKICEVAMFTMLGIWPSIVQAIITFNSERRLFSRMKPGKQKYKLDSFSRYFHILGIDILLSENLQPVLLELNDRPSMVVTYEVEAALKRDLIYDAFSHISMDGSAVDSAGSKWQKLLPCDSDRATQVREVVTKSAVVFKTYSSDRERPHYEGARGGDA
jgi:hypothetical protein